MAKKKKKTVKRKAVTAKRKKCVHGKEIMQRQKVAKGVCRCCGRKKHVTLTLRTGVWRCCYCKPEQFPTSCRGCGWTRRRKRSRRNRRK